MKFRKIQELWSTYGITSIPDLFLYGILFGGLCFGVSYYRTRTERIGSSEHGNVVSVGKDYREKLGILQSELSEIPLDMTIKIGGATSAAQLMVALSQNHDNITNTDAKGTLEGVKDLLAGNIQISFASKEIEHPDLDSYPIERVPIVFFVKKDTPINNISSNDLKQIYQDGFGSLNSHPVIAIYRSEVSGTQKRVEEYLGFKPRGEEVPDSMVMVVRRVFERDGIGFNNAYQVANQGSIKILTMDGQEWINGGYINNRYPLFGTLYVVTKKNSGVGVQELVSWLRSDIGRQFVIKSLMGR